MTELLSDLATPSDAELISSVRGGDVAAYGDLFARHRAAADRLARQLVRGPDADDLVSEAFAKVLSVLQGGGGPDVAFRAYLLTAVRRLHVDKMRAGAKLQTSDDLTPYDTGVPFFDTAVASFENGAAAKAFAALPERWQLVLWHLEVEGQKPADIAPLLGMSANSVSALAYRAREGLRQAFLTMHLNDISDADCRWINEHLGAFVRKGLSHRDSTKVRTHLDQCRRCSGMYLELTDINSNLAAIIAPLLLGGAAAGYVASTGAASAGGLGLLGLVDRVRDVVAANAGAATAGAVAASVAAVASTGVLLLPSKDRMIAGNGPVDSVPSARATAGDAAPDGSARISKQEPSARVAPPASSPGISPGTALPAALSPALPSELPSEPPSASADPTTAEPSLQPTSDPTVSPTEQPTGDVSADPVVDPGADPSSPTDPTTSPGDAPSSAPSPSSGPASPTPSVPTTPPPSVPTTPPPTTGPPPGVAADGGVRATVDMQGNSGIGTVTAAVTIDRAVPVVVDVAYREVEVAVTLPDDCTPTLTGALCEMTGPGALAFPVELTDRMGHETHSARIGFTVSVPGHKDPRPDNDTSWVTVERFWINRAG
jgi:RNA polymerase sigma factor (sigma-70 family)